jgi:cytoskeletal protein RodZ
MTAGSQKAAAAMFEIGNSLREARLRQGLDLARVEDDTKIRARYLQALEDERFDVLPAETYVKGFLRTYAEYLGLDGHLYVDEFNSRFASAVDEPIVASPPPRRRPTRGTGSGLVVVVLAGIVAVAVLVVVAFAFSSDPTADPTAGTNAPKQRTVSTPTSSIVQPPAPAPAKAVQLAIRAVRGDCWVTVHRGSASGPIAFSGTIYKGEVQRFRNTKLVLEFGDAPTENLNVSLNGHRAQLPAGAQLVIVTSRGIQPAQG